MYVPNRSTATANPARSVPSIAKRRIDAAMPEVIRRVVADPRVRKALVAARVVDREAFIEKLARPIVAENVSPLVRKLEEKLAAEDSILARGPIERDLRFAKLAARAAGGAA